MISEAKTIICSTCGASVSSNVKKCPYCCSILKNKKKKYRGRFAFICVCLSLLMALFIVYVDFYYNDEETYIVKDTTISLSEFNKIQAGMTYREVVSIIGIDGELVSEVSLGGAEYTTQIYIWEGNGYVGSNANITFQGGTVISKAQAGLE